MKKLDELNLQIDKLKLIQDEMVYILQDIHEILAELRRTVYTQGKGMTQAQDYSRQLIADMAHLKDFFLSFEDLVGAFDGQQIVPSVFVQARSSLSVSRLNYERLQEDVAIALRKARGYIRERLALI